MNTTKAQDPGVQADGIKCIRQATTSSVEPRFKPSNRCFGVRKALVRRNQAAKAFCLANNVVLTAGHPFPGPFKFCRVINAAFIRVLWLWFELSVGNVILTEGLFTAIPAWTSLTRDCKAKGNDIKTRRMTIQLQEIKERTSR